MQKRVVLTSPFLIAFLLIGTISSSVNFASAAMESSPTGITASGSANSIVPALSLLSTTKMPAKPDIQRLPSIPALHKTQHTVGPLVTITAAQSGDWNNGTTWVGGIVPGISDNKIIPSGINVTVTTEVDNNGTITNSGTITVANFGSGSIGIYSPDSGSIITNNSGGQIIVANTGINSDGIVIYGTFINSGTIAIPNSGINSYGIQNSGTFINSGTITISNSGYIGILNIAPFSNSGTITISNSIDSSYGIVNYLIGTITNNSGGQITAANSGFGSQGIYNFVTITNNSGGQITLANSGDSGISNGDGSTLTNYGTITISNSGLYGIYNQYTFTNNSGGQVIVSNTGASSYGIVNYNGSTLTNSGIITVQNTGAFSTGISNSGTISNTGTITINSGGTIDNPGTINEQCGGTFTNNGTQTGNPVVDACHQTTLALNPITSVPWSQTVTITGKLTDNNLSGAGIGGQTITFSGSGNVFSSVMTASDGTFTASGTARGTVSTWQVNASFATSMSYQGSSATQSYSTTKHNVSVALTKPANVPWSRPTLFTATLTDATAGGTTLSAKTISYNGTGVIGVANVITNATGIAVGHGISPSTVSTGLTAQAHFAGDTLYNSADSTVQTFNTLKHNVSLGLAQPTNVPWSRSTLFVTILADITAGNTAISLAPISFTGTGVIGVANVITNATGIAVGHGISPSTVSTGLTAQAHFAGNGHYNAADSLVRTYNTLAHSTSLTLALTPSTVLHGAMYNVTGTLRDATANVLLGSRTVTFTATSPITIPSQVTTTTGTYSALRQVAPSIAGSYGITSHFTANSLYGASNSPPRTLTVS